MMNDFLELAAARQSCRAFADRPVEHDKLVKCVEAARLAPSACNSQPWSFVVVEDPLIVPEVAKTSQVMGINEYISGARAFIVMLEEHAVLMPKLRAFIDSQYFAKGDLGGALLSLCLEAESLGLGTCILGLFNREKLCELLAIPPGKQFAGLVAVGYPASPETRPKVRKPLESIVRFV